jgi:ribose-phosphate pyrophosphokinase
VGIEIVKFPDGQQNVNLKLSDDFDFNCQTTIVSRLNNWMDLELIVCTTRALRNLGVQDVSLYVPYIMGGRSDRKFEVGSTNYIKDVISPILNSMDFKKIYTYDPHSDVTEACYNNLIKLDNILLPKVLRDYNRKNVVLISPDSGASKKVTSLAKQFNFEGDIMYCSKYRNSKGELTDNFIPWDDKYKGKTLIIVDDICDGGRTFINLADDIRKYDDTCELVLCVSHGIFSKGLQPLIDKFNKIYCTNSFNSYEISNQFHQINVF